MKRWAIALLAFSAMGLVASSASATDWYGRGGYQGGYRYGCRTYHAPVYGHYPAVRAHYGYGYRGYRAPHYHGYRYPAGHYYRGHGYGNGFYFGIRF